LWGIWIAVDSKSNIITGNTISKNNIGIYVYPWSCNISIIGNILSKNNIGILLEGSFNNNIQKNNFYFNKVHARFTKHIEQQGNNSWSQNFWGRPRIFPKLVHGRLIVGNLGFIPIFIPWIDIDQNPALLPNRILV
jgi:parallel beta-helix repeat protein